MDKNRDINRYINTIKENQDFFEKYYYHSIIDLNLIKLDSILQNGILCKYLIESKNLPSLYTHSSNDYDSKNGNNFISLTKYSDKTTFNSLFEAFPFHTLTCLSLLVDKGIPIYKEGDRETFFDDEIFCEDSIDKSKIKGILIPEHLSNLKLSEVNSLPSDLNCYTKTYLNNWLSSVEKYFGNSIPKYYIEELKESYKSLWEILNTFGSPEKWLESAIWKQREKYGKDIKDVLACILEYMWSLKYNDINLKYIDIVNNLNNENIPIYEVGENRLKKEN